MCGGWDGGTVKPQDLRAGASRSHCPDPSRWLLAMPLALLLLPGCTRERAGHGYVARVGEAVLTEQGLTEAAHDSLGGPRLTARQYINTWIVNELLYQEAERRGLTNSEALQRQLDEVKKHLAIQALLDKEVYADDTSQVTEEAIEAYFAAHRSSLVLSQDVVKASYVLFANRDLANTFRSRVLRGTSWEDAVRQLAQDSTQAGRLLRVVTNQYCTHATLYPEELWKLARSLGRNEVSFVVNTPAGFYVLKSLGSKHQGEVPDLDYVYDDIRNRLLIDERRARYERLIADLRSRQPVDVREMDTTSAVE